MLGKGLKRKRSRGEEEGAEEEGAESASAPPPSNLFSLSVSKLHRSLQRGEPDLRPLVLVANALRRIQHSAQPPPALQPLDHLLLAGMDASLSSSAAALLEELASSCTTALGPPAAQPDRHAPSPELGRTAQLGFGSPEEPSGPGGALLEEGLDSLFEDIDTSMYDCDPWAPGKEGCPGTETGRQDLADLDYLLEVLVGAEEK